MPADRTPRGTITVPGRGTVRIDPDVATIRLGVVVVRPTAADARTAAASTMGSVIGALTGGGVERRDLRTTLVGLDAVRDYSSESGPRVTGYQRGGYLQRIQPCEALDNYMPSVPLVI